MIPYEKDWFPPSRNWIASFGRDTLLLLRNTGRALLIIIEAVLALPLAYRYRPEIVRQMVLCGFRSFAVTAIVAFFTGMILALQAGLELQKFGQEAAVGTIVVTSMCREMGPLMTALILAASVGSAMAAEIGTMAVSDEIAALQSMSISPVRLLVLPRLIAMVIMCPALTVYTTLIGAFGGAIVGETQLNVSFGVYYDHAFMFLVPADMTVGVVKAFVFSLLITMIACYQGLMASNGALGVGRATRSTVVYSFLAILISGYVISRMFY